MPKCKLTLPAGSELAAPLTQIEHFTTELSNRLETDPTELDVDEESVRPSVSHRLGQGDGKGRRI